MGRVEVLGWLFGEVNADYPAIGLHCASRRLTDLGVRGGAPYSKTPSDDVARGQISRWPTRTKTHFTPNTLQDADAWKTHRLHRQLPESRLVVGHQGNAGRVQGGGER